MLSRPGVGRGSGKVFGNIGGPVTLKVHRKESIVSGQERSHAISRVQNELRTKNFSHQNQKCTTKPLHEAQNSAQVSRSSKKGAKLASQQNQASSKGILVLFSRNVPQDLFTRHKTLFPAPRSQHHVAVMGVLTGLLA